MKEQTGEAAHTRQPKFSEGVSRRRAAREWAVQILFRQDMNPVKPEKAVADFWTQERAGAGDKAFAEELVCGVWAEKSKIDEWISRSSANWTLDRMPATDRNVLRLGVYELLCRKDIPASVSINEAVDLARFFGASGSGKFVNGVLDRVRKELGR